MTLTHWKTIWTALKRTAAALPAAGAVLGVAMAALGGPFFLALLISMRRKLA